MFEMNLEDVYNALSANPTKWSNTLEQFVGYCYLESVLSSKASQSQGNIDMFGRCLVPIEIISFCMGGSIASCWKKTSEICLWHFILKNIFTKNNSFKNIVFIFSLIHSFIHLTSVRKKYN